MGSEAQHVFIQALPPATDYITYSTLVEHNLTPENLPVLHDVLQDTKLTINIGWDLVLPLLPLLPASQQCLQDVARLGNPREVVLKVTEALRLLQNDAADSAAESDEEDDEPLAPAVAPGLGESSVSAGAHGAKDVQAQETPLPVIKFQSLLSMLSILHARIKTKYPSRFLSTTLQAVLAAFPKSGQYLDEVADATLKLVRSLAGTKRPHLPPRMSSQNVLSGVAGQSAPDPEADATEVSSGDIAIQKRLLQSFITHVLEDYMLSLPSEDDVVGFSWSSRLQEKLHPERTVPTRPSFAEKFTNSGALQNRTTTLGQIVALAQDLDIDSKELVSVITDIKEEASGRPSEEDEPPASAKDIPLSKTGCVFLLAARKASELLYETSPTTSPLNIFPDHAKILQNFIGTTAPAAIGLEPNALIDTVLFLGTGALEKNNVGEPESDEKFMQYLQTTSLLAANTPEPQLRYHANYLTSSILRSHPSDLARLSFIRDTLEHCPYENLKATAVSWLKGETVEANPFKPAEGPTETSTSDSRASIFATPVALSAVSPFLFADLTHDLEAPSLVESYTHFKTHLSFYLATLNFYYLLLRAEHLHEPLNIASLHQNSDVGGSYLGPLRTAAARFKEELGKEGELRDFEDGDVKGALLELRLLEDTLSMVEGSVKGLNKA